jgi:hypothetical protein
MQCESFLEHQRQMHSRHGQDNAQSWLGLTQIPTTPQIRNILDKLAAKELFRVFTWVYQSLQRDGYLKPYHCLGGHLLVTLDGTQYFSSQSIHCECCSSRTPKNGNVTYFHSAIVPVIVAPGQPQVISLAPEFITPQDGAEKQDSEVAAAKRWINNYASEFKNQPVTLLGDDLYSRQPMVELSGEHWRGQDLRNIPMAQTLERNLLLSLRQSHSLERHSTRLGSQLV